MILSNDVPNLNWELYSLCDINQIAMPAYYELSQTFDELLLEIYVNTWLDIRYKNMKIIIKQSHTFWFLMLISFNLDPQRLDLLED